MNETFVRAWLLGWLSALGLSLGCLLLLMLDQLVGGRWGAAIRPTLEAGARTLPVWGLGFAPVAIGLEALYPWTDPTFMAADAALRHKATYLSSSSFILRGIVALIAWTVFAIWLTAPSQRLRGRFEGRRPGVAAVGLIVVFLSATVTAVDWIASLDPQFFSSAFGLAVLTGQIVAGLSAVLMIAAFRRAPTRAESHDLGNLLLTALLLWAYVGFAQYLLVWSADLPDQSAWYLARGDGPWLAILASVAIVRLGLCLFALLLRPIKRDPRRLAAVGFALLVTYLLELYWFVLPSTGEPVFSVPDGLLPPLFVGAWVLATSRAGARREARDG